MSAPLSDDRLAEIRSLQDGWNWRYGRDKSRVEVAFDDLLAEVDRLSDTVDVYENPSRMKLERLLIEEGEMNITTSGDSALMKRLAVAFLMLLGDAENYVEQGYEWDFRSSLDSGIPNVKVLITSVRRPHGKTPHELRRLAEAERDTALAEVDRLRERLTLAGVALNDFEMWFRSERGSQLSTKAIDAWREANP